MNNPNNWTVEEIQLKLEGFIYQFNTAGSKKEKYLHFFSTRGVASEEERARLAEYRDLSNLDDSETEDFYEIVSKGLNANSLKVEIDDYGSDPFKVMIGLRTEKKDKESFKKLIEMGWKFHDSFQYTCSQEGIFDKNRKVAKLIFNTIHLFNMYRWKSNAQEDGED